MKISLLTCAAFLAMNTFIILGFIVGSTSLSLDESQMFQIRFLGYGCLTVFCMIGAKLCELVEVLKSKNSTETTTSPAVKEVTTEEDDSA